mmetsp:Transcript_3867/g.5404  ORF Transcript_3867/g.5404 Transcript_3867/m.5404 type:complete len:1062 (+) Transcript_3867:120-3305(+)
MEPQQLVQLETLCEKLYTASDQASRTQVEQALLPFSTRTDYIGQAKFVLDTTQSPYAQHFAASSILKLISNNWNSFSSASKVEIKNHVLNFLANKGPKISSFVNLVLFQILTKITKNAWFDGTSHQQIVEEVSKFLKYSSDYYLLGLRIFNQLVTEINELTPGSGLLYTQHRRIANSFRDKCLLTIFETALNTLKELYKTNMTSDALTDQLREQALELSFRCLSYDFIGTSPEDSQDDIGTVHLPASWKNLFETDATIKLFLHIYKISPPQQAVKAMRCLVQIASISRSTFTGQQDRDQFLRYLLESVKDILHNRTGLNDEQNHHEFCRLLARLKGNYQLSQIISAEGNYSDWLTQISVFTLESLNRYDWPTNSVFYLLTFWSRLVVSMSYSKESGAYALLQNIVPQIIKAFIDSRMEAAQMKINEDIEEEEEQLLEQLDALPHLGRCNYEAASTYLMTLFDPIAQTFRGLIEYRTDPTSKELQIVEERLSWLVHAIGQFIGGRQASSPDQHDSIDADLSSRVFQLITIHDSRINQKSCESNTTVKLELAFLGFLEEFRKAYVGDQSKSSAKIYQRLNELLGLSSDMMILGAIVSKIIATLKYWPRSEPIIGKALGLLQELALGYSSSKRLLKLDITVQFLSMHTSQFFPFLDCEPLRRRTTYYSALARLLFMEDNAAKFEAFMDPFKKSFMVLNEQNQLGMFRSENCKNGITGILRDLRGIASACTARRSYMLLFDWLYPEYFGLIIRACEVWFDSSAVMTSLLKFAAEFVFNRGGRITFDTSSVNGILLFREISKIVVTYGSRVLTFNPTQDLYNAKYKGISLCLLCLTRTFNGNYINFGVFDLYGDPALAGALDISLKLILAIPLSDVLAYPKLQKIFYGYLEVLCNNHTAQLARVDTSVFVSILTAIKEGLDTLDVNIVTSCCVCLDKLVSYSLSTNAKGKDVASVNLMKRHVAESAEMMCSLMSGLLRKILFEECPNLWSLSRPLLSLILLHTEFFTKLQAQLIELQPADVRPQLQKNFTELMTEVQSNLEYTNRDKFSQNLNAFVQEIKKYIVNL